MAGLYVDTSALGRVLLGEPDAPAIVRELRGFDQPVASELLRVELRRVGLREGLLGDADRLLSAIALVPLDAGLLQAAETVGPSSVATLDAIHLVTALRLADRGAIVAVLTYDERLAEGARRHGIDVLAPG
ncbi:MAG: type II toxin-antitoxin system VapC family toxin [Thermoleophilaceae bacterium]